MGLPHFPHMQEELERQIQARTGRRVRNLTVELYPERVVLRGHASTYYIKQLAQQGVQDILPDIRLENAIVVDHTVGMLSGTSAKA